MSKKTWQDVASEALDWIALIVILIVLVLSSGCSGGGDNPRASLGGTAGNTGTPTRSVLYGYYNSWDYTVLETQDHVTLQWAGAFGTPAQAGISAVKNRLREARMANARCVILDVSMAYSASPEQAVRGYFTALNDEGLIDSRICALYPADEPDLNVPGSTAEKVRVTNAMLRRVASEFPFISGIPLAVIYTARKTWPGIETYDWVGFDDYGHGSEVLSNDVWVSMKANLRPDQRIILVPGAIECANIWDFYAKSQEDPQVLVVMPFIWYDLWDSGKGQGLRSLPCKQDYIDAALRLKSF